MHITRRDTAKLILATTATGMTGGTVEASEIAGIGKVTIEWQAQPLALDTLRPRFRWTLIAPRNQRGYGQSAFRLSISDAYDALIFDTGHVTSTEMALRPTADLPLKSQAAYSCQLEVWDPKGQLAGKVCQTFATGILAAENNRGQWLAAEADIAPRQAIEGHWYRVDKAQPLPLFRKAFKVTRPLRHAHLCVAGLGQYQLWLDHEKLSPDGLNGGWTNYNRRVLYDAYDVTDRLKAGDHLLGLALGNGFFNLEVLKGRYSKLDGTFGRPQMWAQLRIVYADGSEEIVVSDATWQARYGGTVYSSIYGGEDFDARRDDGRFGGEDWLPATVITGPTGQLRGSTFRPMVVRERLKPKVTKAHDSAIVYDFGLNHSGRPTIRLNNVPAGTIIRLVPSELLAEDGTADQQSMVGSKARGYCGIAFTYTARGEKTETWSPQFTYTGYRYIQVEGIGKAHIDFVESQFLSNDIATTGTITCSDKRMELIHGLIRQALISNSASVLTDCPTREKLGWLEQIYLNAATALMNSDMARVYEKMMADICDAQEPDGKVPTIAPEFTKFLDKDGKDTKFRDSPEWGSALILGAWSVYKLHRDKGILEQNYDAMTRRIAYVETRVGTDGLLDYGLGDWYDIGPKNPGVAQLTSRKMTGTATFYAELTTLAKITRILGAADVGKYLDRAETLRQALREKLFDPARSVFDSGSQTAQAMALVLGLFPDDHRAKALTILVDDIRVHQNHTTAGDIGFHYVVRALTEGGRSDVLYDMLSRIDKPAYLEQIANGATSLTESWDSWRESSQNHFMLGHAEIWFYQGLGGLDIDLSRKDAIILAPQPVAGINDQSARYDAITGRVSCRLRRDHVRWRLTAEVPAGQDAIIVLSQAQPETVREGRNALAETNGISDVQAVQGNTSFTVSSGVYDFSWPVGL